MATVALIDTNVLLRLLQPQHSQYSTAATALAELRKQRADLCIAPQNIVEFWVVATRPVALNGLGLTPPTVAGEVQKLKTLFRLLEGKPGVTDAWEQLVSRRQVCGKLAHDAHLVALMRVYSVSHILTFNGADFERFGVTILDPAHSLRDLM